MLDSRVKHPVIDSTSLMEDSKVTRDLVIFLPNHTKVYRYHRLIVVTRRFCDN